MIVDALIAQMEKLPPNHTLKVRCGSREEFEKLRSDLEEAGLKATPRIMNPATFVVHSGFHLTQSREVWLTVGPDQWIDKSGGRT